MTHAETLAQAYATGQQIAPLSDADPQMDMAAGYAVQRQLTALRVAAGAKVVGVKVGFTNTQIWEQYGIHAPIHAPVFDTTLAQGTVSLTNLMDPLIEPEVVLKLRATPTPDMDDDALLACIDAAAAGFEIVHSAFPGWRCKAQDSIAARGMHAALALGDWVNVDQSWKAPLSNFIASLACNGTEQATGEARNLLGSGPLAVLRHLIALDSAEPLLPGQLVSTGTVTKALPVTKGQTWSVTFTGLKFGPLQVRLV